MEFESPGGYRDAEVLMSVVSCLLQAARIPPDTWTLDKEDECPTGGEMRRDAGWLRCGCPQMVLASACGFKHRRSLLAR